MTEGSFLQFEADRTGLAREPVFNDGAVSRCLGGREKNDAAHREKTKEAKLLPVGRMVAIGTKDVRYTKVVSLKKN